MNIQYLNLLRRRNLGPADRIQLVSPRLKDSSLFLNVAMLGSAGEREISLICCIGIHRRGNRILMIQHGVFWGVRCFARLADPDSPVRCSRRHRKRCCLLFPEGLSSGCAPCSYRKFRVVCSISTIWNGIQHFPFHPRTWALTFFFAFIAAERGDRELDDVSNRCKWCAYCHLQRFDTRFASFF